MFRCCVISGCLLSLVALALGCNTQRTPATVTAKPVTPAPVKQPASPAAPVETSADEPASADDPAAGDENAADPQPASSDDDAGDEPAESLQPDGAGATTAISAPADPWAGFPRERFVILAPEAFLVVELILSIDGAPHTVALDKLVERVLAAADTDKNDRPTWDEVAESATFRAGLFGNQPLTGYGMVQNMKRLYDIDNDGVVDADEVPRFVTRNVGGSKAFSLLSANYNRDHNRLDSPLRRLIDYNQDGMLSDEEIAAAPTRVRSFDSDGDDILYPVDFKAPSDVIVGAQQMQLIRGQGPPTAVLLSPAVNWATLLYSLEEMYAYGGALSPDSFPRTPELFAQLDDDGDGKIDRYEVQRLADKVEPHIVLAAHFGAPSDSSQSPASTKEPAEEAEETEEPDASSEPPADEPAENAPSEEAAANAGEAADATGESGSDEAQDQTEAETAAAPTETTDEATEENSAAETTDEENAKDDEPSVDEPPTEMAPAAEPVYFELLSISPDLGARDEIVTELDRRISLLLPAVEIEFYMNDAADDSNLEARARGLLGMYDGNNDGYLEEDEIPENAPGLTGDFAVIDSDSDGKIYAKEIEALLAEQQAAGRSQIRARAYDQEDALFTALDVDNDGRLNAREIDALVERLQSFDTNGDGHLATYEIPASIAIGIARGDPNQGENLFIMPAGYRRASSESAPKWFVDMDANADGDVSPREFLGGAEVFQRLDRDGDGYVTRGEAAAAAAESSAE